MYSCFRNNCIHVHVYIVEFESDEGKKIEEEEDDFTFTHVVTTGLRRLSSALFGSMTVDDEADDEV